MPIVIPQESTDAQARFIQDGRAIDYTPDSGGGDCPAGTVVLLEDGLIGVVKTDIAAGELGALHLTGVYEFLKSAGAGTGDVFAAGNTVYWNAAMQQASADSGTNAYPAIGRAVAAAADVDATVKVVLMQGAPVTGTA